MSIIFSIIFWIALLRFIIPVIKGAKNQKDTTNSVAFQKARQAVNTFSPNNTYYTQKRESLKEKDVELHRMENRENDWLAKQLRCERQSQIVVSDMFQLKQEHLSDCDAHSIREEHYQACDARTNQETYRGTDKMSQADMDALKERIKQRNN